MIFRASSLAAVVAFLLVCGPSSAQQSQAPPSKYALLIGIDQYEHQPAEIKLPASDAQRQGRYAPDLIFTNLYGPPHDVDSMGQILVSKFGFPNDPGHMFVLTNSQATRDDIMLAMQKYLVDTPKKGDTVVMYVSAHGSLRIYPKGQGQGQLYDLLDDPSDQRHVENTIVPYDWNNGVDDIFSRDLRHFYREAVDKGVHVTAIFDLCHSGDLGRGLLSGKIATRDFLFDPREMTPDPYAKQERPTLPQDDPLNPVLILSAAQKDQLAIDDGTKDPPHGLFTSALLDALEALPADRPAADVFNRLQVSMELSGATHQQPEIDTTADRRRLPIFGGEAGSGPATTVVESVSDKGVLLDIGIVADIGPGSVFTTMNNRGMTQVDLKVTASEGLSRSLAQVQTAGGIVHPRDLVQLKTAVPWQRPNLMFYAGVANPPLSELQADVALVKSKHITLASDPSQDPWTHHLYWDGLHWMLSPHSTPSNGKPSKPIEPVNLGQELTPKSLGRVPSGAIVWFDPPLAREVVQALLPSPDQGAPPLAAKLTNNRSAAMYVIGAKVEGGNISFAWFKRSDVDSEVQTPKWIGAGCSPGSSYPLRTDWIDQSSVAPTAAALTKYAIKLARLNGWYLLQSSSLDNHQGFPYSLVLRSETGGQNVGENGVTNPGKYYLYLEGTPTQDTQPRWVYVLNISCQGDGVVVWPFDAPPGKISQPAAMFPIDDATKRSPEIPLPGYPFPVGAPLGTDTYILLTTSTPLTNYHALAFDSVVSRNVIDNPLEDLLDDVSQGTRDAGEPIPTDWGVWSMQVQSIPTSGPHP